MSIVHLYDNLVGPWGSTGPNATTNITGMRFIPTIDVQLQSIRYLRGVDNSGWTPTAGAVYRASDQVKVAEASSINTTAGTGWRDCPLTSTPVLNAGVEYRVCFVGMANWGRNAYSLPVAPPGLSWTTSAARCSATNSVIAFPSNTDSSFMESFDVTVEQEGAATGGGATPTDLANEFADWFSLTDNTHPDDLPQETYDLLGLTDAAVDAIAAELTIVHTAIDAVQDVTDTLPAPINTIVGWGLGNTQADIDTILTWVALAESRLTGASAGGGSAFSALADQIASATAPLSPVQFPSTGWAQVAETTFDTSLAWAQAADLYVVTFADLGLNIVNTVADGVDVSYRLAWWCPLNGEFGRERRFIDFPDAHLEDGGRRMPGLLLHSPAGGTGTVQAWTYTP